MGVALLAVLAVLGSTAFARAQDDEGPTSSVRVVVVRDTDGKPVKYAQVVLHPMNRKGKSKGEMDLKTDADGRASLDGSRRMGRSRCRWSQRASRHLDRTTM